MDRRTPTPRAFLLGTALLLLLATAPSVSFGQWVEGGFRVADSAYPSYLAQAEDGAGGSFLLWTGYGYTGDLDLFASRVTSEGLRPPGWPVAGVTVCATPGVQLRSAAVPDGSGGIFAIWRDGRGLNPLYDFRSLVLAQHLRGDGTLDSGWPSDGLFVTADTTDADIAALSDNAGGAYVAWTTAGPDGDVRVQRLEGTGTVASGWPTDGVLVCGAPHRQVIQKAVPDGSGGLYLAWEDWRRGWPDAYVQHVTSLGEIEPWWPPDGVLVNDPANNVPLGSTLCPDGRGGILAFWRDGVNGDAFERRMSCARIGGDGSRLAGWSSAVISISGYSSDERAECASASGGGGFVVWPRAGNDYKVHAQRVLPDGSQAPGWPDEGILIGTGSDYNFAPTLASDGAGGMYVLWTYSIGGPGTILIQHVLPDGATASGWPPGGVSISLGIHPNPVFPMIVPTQTGGAIVAWEALDGVYAQRVDANGVPYFTLSVVDAIAEPDRATITWRASSSLTDSIAIYRQKGDEGWALLRKTAIGPEGAVRLEDRGVSPGQRYGYRVGTTFQGADHLYGEVEVETPRFSLHMDPVAGNPVRQSLALSMTLPTAEPARVELFDMRGRRLDSMNVLGQGRHLVTLGTSRSVASGIYVVRLSQGGRTTSSKVAFLR